MFFFSVLTIGTVVTTILIQSLQEQPLSLQPSDPSSQQLVSSLLCLFVFIFSQPSQQQQQSLLDRIIMMHRAGGGSHKSNVGSSSSSSSSSIKTGSILNELSNNQVANMRNKVDTTASLDSTTTKTSLSSSSSSSSDSSFSPAAAWTEENVQEVVSLWSLPDAERVKLETLGRRLQDVHHEKNVPREVIRFLRKEHGNVDAAESSFRKMIKWRIENNVDTILQDYRPSAFLLEYYPASLLRDFDKHGEPIFLERTGMIDYAGLLKKVGREELIRHAIWIREKVIAWGKQYQQQNNKKLQHLSIISDAHGLKIMESITNRHVVSVFNEMMRIDQEYYPEGARHIFITRVPKLFEVGWKIIRHFFHSSNLQKMIICSTADYKTVLSQHMDLQILPDCIVPGIGQGQSADDWFPTDFKGGPVPR
jgi:hypothetical protein